MATCPRKDEQAENPQSDDPVFVQEREHLRQTYVTMEAMEAQLTEKMRAVLSQAMATKRQMTEEIRQNFGSDTEAFETYTDFQTVNNVIDSYNQVQDAAAEKLADIRLLKEQPYFAKVSLGYKPDEPPKDLYIGAVGLSDPDCRRMVVDWRSPVAEVYYNQDMGPTSYKANGRTIEVDLKLRRQFDIAGDELRAYFDTNIAIQDELLLASLSKERSSQMQVITATIQKEQNEVIRHEDCPALLVAGIAGSGKTSVLMQRIAYLFYRQRGSLRPQDVFLISPNEVFSRYISGVLPDMGERNPETLTLAAFFERLLPTGQGAGSGKVDIDLLWRIDEAVDSPDFDFVAGDFQDIRVGKVKLLTAGQVRQVREKFRKIEAGARLANLMREELEKRLDAKLATMAASDDYYDAVLQMPIQDQIALFGEPCNMGDEREVRRCALKLVKQRFGDAYGMLARDEWLHVDKLSQRVLGLDSLPPVAWLYLKMAATGLGNHEARYVMIDEVQDYTPAQLAVLARFFRRANFMLLGDESQAIREEGASFADVREVFGRLRGQVQTASLMTSYRSTPGITELFARFLPEGARMRVQSVQRQSAPPRIEAFASEEEWLAAVHAAVAAAREEEGGITAVIAPWRHEAIKLAELLGDDAPEVLSEGSRLPKRGCVIIPLPIAKGLEFDHVIVPDASTRLFDNSRLGKNRLYTTISRATSRIDIFALGELAPELAV